MRKLAAPLRFGLCWALPLVALVAAPAVGWAQDVEVLGERFGTRPPDAYYETLARDPLAFQFVHGRAARLRARMSAPADPGVLRVLGPRDGPVQGDVRIPVVLGLFADSPDSLRFSVDSVQAAFFGSGPGTIPHYYSEVSGGRVNLQGDVFGFVRSQMTQVEATRGQSGLGSGLAGDFIVELLEGLDGVDWGLYDNDGPDGVPNSGDDDGFVDALGVIQPTAGAECGGSDRGDRIWSHRWNLRAAAGAAYQTGTAAASGGFIQIDDYTIQPIFACNGQDLSQIGVFTHELGHAFGLPDLYDTSDADGKHAGAGNWDLMATGSWGCDGNSPESPCHMGAWSKAVLGWVDVDTLSAGTDYGTLTLGPVEQTGTVYRVEAQDGSEDYFLLENRQQIGYDAFLPAEGLLIWHIDPVVVRSNWGWNGVNAREHMGVWLRQADGLNELGTPGGGRGDRSDPFPYQGVARLHDAFHWASVPAARTHAGGASGLTITDITRAGDDVTLSLTTRLTNVTLRTQGDSGSGGLLTVDGLAVPGATYTFASAPFVEHTVEAAAGESVEPGRRRGFEGWLDDGDAPRVRTVETPMEDLELTAQYGKLQLQLSVELSGGVDGIDPGTFSSTPASSDLWFEEGAAVTVEAVPVTGFAFVRWTGDLAGQPNPASFTITEPMAAGAEFQLTYAVPAATLVVEAAATLDIQLEVENGSSPVTWTRLDGDLPPGLTLGPAGRITGVAMEMGTYPLTLRARDAIGLTGETQITLDVVRPSLGIEQLASDFLSVGTPLNGDQRRFLDRQGNGDGSYDLGDFRAWVLANPDLPWTAAVRALIGPREVVLKSRAAGTEGGR